MNIRLGIDLPSLFCYTIRLDTQEKINKYLDNHLIT